MPLPGGTSAKAGLRYEALWTVRCVAEILAERADAIRVEPPGREGEGVEFWFRLPGSVEYHQVKRQNPRGHWALAALNSEGVLGHFKDKLGDPNARCVFVSAQDAPELHELGDRARRASSAEEFRSAFIQSEKQARWLDEICEAWGRCPESQGYEWLRRIEVRPIGEEVLRPYTESLLSSHVEGDPATITDVLSQYTLAQVNTELTAQDLWQHLESRGFRRREWHKDPRVLAAVEETTGRYVRLARQSAIAHQVIPREEAVAMVEALTSADSELNVIAVGEAGTGKSGALLQVVETVKGRGWPVIAFRVDRLKPSGLPDEVGRQLGLPGSPARVLGAVAHGRECLLVIDQLDAVSLVSGRASRLFECLNEVIAQARAYPAMRLLLACRKFDLDNDPRLRRLTGEDGLAKEVVVGRLSRSSVEAAVRQLGLDPARLTSRQWDLLALPLHLGLVAEIAGAGDSDVFDLEAAQDLYDRFWSRKQDVLRERLDRPARWTEVIDTLSDFMNTHQVLSVPESILDEVETDAKAMASEHVLVLDRGRYGFFHEGFFDYAFARRFVARGGKLVQLLGGAEQHLFRRAQVRQILLHERQETRSRYLADLKWLLTAPTVRFHLRAVVFALLADLRDPTPEEWGILERLTEISPPRRPLVRRLQTAALEAGVSMLRRLAPTATGLRGRLSSRLLHEGFVEHAWGVLYRSGAWLR